MPAEIVCSQANSDSLSFYASPRQSANNFLYGRSVHVKPIGQLFLGNATRRIFFANFAHSVFGQLRTGVSFTALLSTLRISIRDVVVVRTQEQVLRVTAGWVVAPM